MKTLKQWVSVYAKDLRCNCDLDNWEPEQSTGHSHVCRIHKAAISAKRDQGLNGGSVTKGGQNRGPIPDIKRPAPPMSAPQQQKATLSERERQVVALTAKGKTASEVGDIMGISSRTVHEHLQSARKKLNTANKTHTVIESLRSGQIKVDGLQQCYPTRT